jgi:hypothetical protein
MVEPGQSEKSTIEYELMMEVQTLRLKNELEAIKKAQKQLLATGHALTIAINNQRTVRLPFV